MDKEKVLNLAKLSRIAISGEEAENLSGEFESILGYVAEVKGINVGENSNLKEDFPIRNVFREDSEGYESGIYTEKILSEAPAREGNYIKVKKIL